jgi:hypothetical protein
MGSHIAYSDIKIIIIIIIFLHGLGLLTRSGIDALPSFPAASTISWTPQEKMVIFIF